MREWKEEESGKNSVGIRNILKWVDTVVVNHT